MELPDIVAEAAKVCIFFVNSYIVGLFNICDVQFNYLFFVLFPWIENAMLAKVLVKNLLANIFFILYAFMSWKPHFPTAVRLMGASAPVV